MEAGSGSGSFTVSMTGLIPNTMYYVRAYAVSLNGTTYGEEVNFTTMIGGVDVRNLGSESIYDRYAYFLGRVTTGGLDILECGFCWSTNSDFSYCECRETYYGGVPSGTYNYTFGGFLSPLTPHTVYYVRAYATTADGVTTYSNGYSSFITPEEGGYY